LDSEVEDTKMTRTALPECPNHQCDIIETVDECCIAGIEKEGGKPGRRPGPHPDESKFNAKPGSIALENNSRDCQLAGKAAKVCGIH
jgi:hypothetical protein